MIEEPLSSHLEALRTTLLKAALAIFVGVAFCFIFSESLIAFLSQTAEIKNQDRVYKELHYGNEGKENRIVFVEGHWKLLDHVNVEVKGNSLIIGPAGYADIKTLSTSRLALFSPLEGFKIAIKISFWAGLIVSFPFWILTVIRFFLPALTPQEKKLLVPFLLLSLVFMSAGVAIGYIFTVPLMNAAFLTFNESLGVNIWGLAVYLDYLVSLLFAHALGFELTVGLFFLIHGGYIESKRLKENRRVAILAALLLGALLTPPDVLSQLLMAGMLILLYELSILYSSVCYKRARDRSCHVDPATLSTR